MMLHAFGWWPGKREREKVYNTYEVLLAKETECQTNQALGRESKYLRTLSNTDFGQAFVPSVP